MRLLIVEDDEPTRGLLERSLREELFRVEAVGDAASAEAHALAGGFDAIVLDLMLPDRDGFTVCRRLRARGLDTPILLLTGRQGVSDRVHGLNAGADDYLPKPFAFEELLARLRAVTRRGRTRQLQAVLCCGPLALEPQTRCVTVDEYPLLLSNTEYRLLEYLMLHAGRPVSRDVLARHVWDQDQPIASNVIDVYVSHLRRKLGSAGALIRTLRGHGYALAGDPPRS